MQELPIAHNVHICSVIKKKQPGAFPNSIHRKKTGSCFSTMLEGNDEDSLFNSAVIITVTQLNNRYRIANIVCRTEIL